MGVAGNGFVPVSSIQKAPDHNTATPSAHQVTQADNAHFAGVMILAGGTGRRLGGVSKPDVRIGGRRLLDLCIDNMPPADHIVVIAPDSVELPQGDDLPGTIHRVLEDPPLSGPAAGVQAGWDQLKSGSPKAPGAGEFIGLIPTDAPLAGKALPILADALAADPAADAALAFANGFAQRTIAVFRPAALQAICAGNCHNISLRKVLARVNVIEVPVDERLVIDVDTPADKDLLGRNL